MSRRLRRHGFAAFALLGAAFVSLACSRTPQTEATKPSLPIEEPPVAISGPPWFADATRESGISFTSRNGEEADQFTILESLGGGVALLDYDGDGRLDVLAAGGGNFAGPNKTDIIGLPCRLFRNRGNGTFEDATSAAGLERNWHYNHGFAVSDFDRDGWPDFVVTGYGRILLFHNTAGPNGTRRFEEASAMFNLKDESWSTSAAWGDINGDGWPDLYLCHYVDWSFANNPHCPGYILGVPRDVCAPQRFKPLVHALFLNEGGKRFREVGAEHGFKAAGCGLGVVIADLNGDSKPDIYVGNDATDNFLFLNRERGKLVESAWRAGVATDESGRYNGSMGVDAADYDRSGRASIWVTNFQGELHALYRNLGHAAPNEAFDHQSRAAGVAAIGTHLVGFGTAFSDFDGDGWEDLVVSHGHVIRRPTLGSSFRQKPVLLRNVERNSRRGFEDASSLGGSYFQKPELGRGLAVGDLDNDGRPDLVISHINSPMAILRNISPAGGWLGLKLTGRDRRDIVGSTVILETSTRRLTRFAKGGGSYLSAHDPRILFRFPDSEPLKRLTVKWSWGAEQSWDAPAPGAYWELREGEPNASRAK